MKLLSAEARKATAAAISSGRPLRPIGTPAASSALTAVAFSSPMAMSTPGVSIAPGATVLTRMPLPFSSLAQVRARDRIAAFDAAYRPKVSLPSSARMELTQLPYEVSPRTFRGAED